MIVLAALLNKGERIFKDVTQSIAELDDRIEEIEKRIGIKPSDNDL